MEQTIHHHRHWADLQPEAQLLGAALLMIVLTTMSVYLYSLFA